MKLKLIPVYILITIIYTSCNKNENTDSNCPENSDILDEFESDQHYILTTAGKVFTKTDGICEFQLQYFSTDFENNYFQQNDTIYARNDEYSIPILHEIKDDFNNYNTFTDLFITSSNTTNKLWTDFVLLSPENSTVEAYVALRKCILAGTCNFDDNRIEIVADTISNLDNKLKFIAVEPLDDMVTSKSSIENTLLHADIDDKVTIEGDFYIEAGFPFSIIDLENKWFEGSPGIRLVFDENKNLSVELKYGLKPWYRQEVGKEVRFPENEWVHVKALFVLRNDETGEIKVWQNNELIIDKKGKTLPTSNSIQTSIETGITATDMNTIMHLDNFRIKVDKF